MKTVTREKKRVYVTTILSLVSYLNCVHSTRDYLRPFKMSSFRLYSVYQTEKLLHKYSIRFFQKLGNQMRYAINEKSSTLHDLLNDLRNRE